jgi:hypothetical protein
MSNTLTISMANYIRGLLEMKDLSTTGGFYKGLAIADITKRDDNGRAIYLDTRSPKALTFDGAKQLIEDLKALPYLHNSREEFLAAKNAAKVAVEAKPEPKKAPAKAKDPVKPKAADGFVKGKFTVGDRSKLAPVGRASDSTPVDGKVYSVYGADFKIVAKADKRGTVRVSLAK